MKIIITLIIFCLSSLVVLAREEGETEITTEGGIEVFQNEKYYLLKKNVKIKSDNLTLNADDVKINFDKSLYDITELNAKGNVDFNSHVYKMKGVGDTLNFEVKNQKLRLEGKGSKLIAQDFKMYSDGIIKINNLNGKFSLNGLNSRLNSENILIKAKSINGIFSEISNLKEISLLNVVDENISYIKNNDIEMYAKKINYNNDTSIIELIDEVTIIRNEEKIIGDYGTLDTTNNSYKIKSNNQSKVKVVIQNNE